MASRPSLFAKRIMVRCCSLLPGKNVLPQCTINAQLPPTLISSWPRGNTDPVSGHWRPRFKEPCVRSSHPVYTPSCFLPFLSPAVSLYAMLPGGNSTLGSYCCAPGTLAVWRLRPLRRPSCSPLCCVSNKYLLDSYCMMLSQTILIWGYSQRLLYFRSRWKLCSSTFTDRLGSLCLTCSPAFPLICWLIL